MQSTAPHLIDAHLHTNGVGDGSHNEQYMGSPGAATNKIAVDQQQQQLQDVTADEGQEQLGDATPNHHDHDDSQPLDGNADEAAAAADGECKENGNGGGDGGGGVEDEGEVDPTNLIINYIPASISEDHIRVLFAPYGTITRVKVVHDKLTGVSLGYGFVKYDSSVSAVAAVSALNGHAVAHKRLKVSISKAPDREKKVNLYISGLPKHWQREHLEQLVGAFGRVLDVRILYDAPGAAAPQGHHAYSLQHHQPLVRRGRGVGFARFESSACAQRCIEALSGTTVEGGIMPLIVRHADTTTDKLRKAMQMQAAMGMAAAAGMGLSLPPIHHQPHHHHHYAHHPHHPAVACMPASVAGYPPPPFAAAAAAHLHQMHVQYARYAAAAAGPQHANITNVRALAAAAAAAAAYGAPPPSHPSQPSQQSPPPPAPSAAATAAALPPPAPSQQPNGTALTAVDGGTAAAVAAAAQPAYMSSMAGVGYTGLYTAQHHQQQQQVQVQHQQPPPPHQALAVSQLALYSPTNQQLSLHAPPPPPPSHGTPQTHHAAPIDASDSHHPPPHPLQHPLQHHLPLPPHHTNAHPPHHHPPHLHAHQPAHHQAQQQQQQHAHHRHHPHALHYHHQQQHQQQQHYQQQQQQGLLSSGSSSQRTSPGQSDSPSLSPTTPSPSSTTCNTPSSASSSSPSPSHPSPILSPTADDTAAPCSSSAAAASSSSASGGGGVGHADYTGYCLFVYHLPLEATESTLYHLFGAYGEVTNAKVMRDLLTGRSKGFGFVNLAQEQHAIAAIHALNGYQLAHKYLKVAFKTK